MTQQKIVDQMNLWDNEDCGTQPGDTSPNGQKCLYKVLKLSKSPKKRYPRGQSVLSQFFCFSFS